MQTALRRLSVRQKLTLVTTATTFVGLVVAFIGVGLFDLSDYRRALMSDLISTADLVAANVAAPLSFGPEMRPEVEEVLRALDNKPIVVAAAIFDNRGRLFVGIGRPEVLRAVSNRPPPPSGLELKGPHPSVYRRISIRGDRLGTLLLVSDQTPYRARLIRYLVLDALVLLFAAWVALVVARPLQRLISEPIARLDGAVRLVSREADYSARVVRDTDDEIGSLIDGFNSMLVAIEERDAQLKDARDSLEERVLERTRELEAEIAERRKTEAHLQEAMRAAGAAAKAKSEFLATMSHEIRTPMNAVIGMTGLLLDTPQSQEQREYTRIIRDSGDALLAIINDILDFSKIEAGQLRLERHPFSLRECVEASIDLVSARAAEKGLDVACDIDPLAPRTVLGDVTRLREVLVNLLSNAVKFTNQGEVLVSVASCSLGDGRYDLHFAVTDTGIGIPPDRRDRLFQAFSQVDASTTRKYGGTGLGLAISQRLVQMMGGEIRVQSVVGQGSTFEFRLEFAESEATEAVHAGPPLGSLRCRTLLIVDDNATNRRILGLQAESWGMDGRSYSSGAEALAALAGGEHIDLAILDIHMPDMDGVELARRIRESRGPKELPLIALSSLGHRYEGLEAPLFQAFLTKPVKQSQLLHVLTAVLSGGETPVQSTGSEPVFDTSLGARIPLRILLAEDIAVNQRLMLTMLNRMGYRADVAANGLEVLDAVRRQAYDVILMDVQMPEMDGLEATRRLRELPNLPTEPIVVALTANAMPEDREACLAVGMDEYLAKPIQVSDLQECLTRCGKSRGVLPAAASPTPAPIAVRPEQPPLLDQAMLATLTGMAAGSPETIRELVEVFASDARQMLERLALAIETADSSSARQAAHALKGAAANMGAVQLSRECAAVEAAARAGSPPTTEIGFQLSELMAETLAALNLHFAAETADTL